MLTHRKKTIDRSTQGEYFPSLDGLRGLAILSVVTFHTFYLQPVTTLGFGAQSLLRSGRLGVPLFFVLSGFLISLPLLTSNARFDPSAYAARRVGKIYPPFLLSLCIFALFPFSAVPISQPFHEIVRHLLTLPHFSTAFPPLNASYWSLFVEIHFYFLAPFWFTLTSRFSHPIAQFSGPLALIVLPFLCRTQLWTSHVDTASEEFLIRLSHFPREFDWFGWGSVFALIYARFRGAVSPATALRLSRIGTIGLFFMFFVYAGLDFQMGFHSAPTWLPYELFRCGFGLVLFCLLFSCLSPCALYRWLFTQPILRFVGLVSYEWFLFHQPLIGWWQRQAGEPSGHILWGLFKTILPMSLTFAFSVTVFVFFSQPLLAWVKFTFLPGSRQWRVDPIPK